MKCIVCKEKFEDGWDHVFVGPGLLKPRDKIHADYLEKVTNSIYSKPCFCGGHITIRGSGEDSWETTCDDCDFLWDED